MTFDFFTLNFVTIVNLLLAGAALLLVSRLNTGCEGLKRCVAGCALLVAGFAFYPLRLKIPGKTLIILTNFPLFAGCMFLLDGVRAFREMRQPGSLYAGLSAGYVGLFLWFLFVNDNATARMVVDGFFIGGAALLAAGVMAWNVSGRETAVYRWTAAMFAMHGISLLVRGVSGLFGGRFVFYQPQTIDLVNAVTLNVAVLGCAFGLSMATNLHLQRRTEKLALYDSLTNLPNRRFFEERLEQVQQSAMEAGRRIALIYCDLDDFKRINDTLGHEGGDRALRIVADRLRALLGADVCLARIGGDEFVVLIENAPSRDAMEALMGRLRKGVEGEVQLGTNAVLLRISCGLAVYPEDVENASDLIRLADAGMYRMKQRRRYPPVPQPVPTGS